MYNHFIGLDMFRDIVSLSNADIRFPVGEVSRMASLRVESNKRTALLLNGVMITWAGRGVHWDFVDDPVIQTHPDSGIHNVSYFTLVSTPVAPIIIELIVSFDLNFYDGDHLQTYTSGFQGFPIAPACEGKMISAELGNVRGWDEFLPSRFDDTKAYRVNSIVKPINIYNQNQLHTIDGVSIESLTDVNSQNLEKIYQQRARISHKGVYTYSLIVILEGLNQGRYRTANEYYIANFHPNWTYTGS
jgi:hypothetical protein